MNETLRRVLLLCSYALIVYGVWLGYRAATYDAKAERIKREVESVDDR